MIFDLQNKPTEDKGQESWHYGRFSKFTLLIGVVGQYPPWITIWSLDARLDKRLALL